jgi:rhamnose transport system permease protein
VGGTLLGLLALVVLQNGLRLSALPAELAGILTGGLLVATILLDRLARRAHAAARAPSRAPAAQEPDAVRNSQVGALSAAALAAALIVAASNWWLVRSLRAELRAAPIPGAATPAASGAPTTRRPVIAVMPKAKGDPYFISARRGADSAARALGVELLWDGPTELDAAKQNEVVEAWITRGVDAIAVSVENRAALSTVLRKARARGIKVVTWDADAERDARDFFVNQATPEGIGHALADEAARILGGRGEFAIITASLSAANQNEWIRHIRARIARRTRPCASCRAAERGRPRPRLRADADGAQGAPERARGHGDRRAAVPGAAEAVQQSGRTDVKVTGLSLPSLVART